MRTDYGAILSTVIKDTSDAIREVNDTSALIAPNAWGANIRTMHSDADYENVMSQLIQETTSGSIASFADGANDLPLVSLKCEVTATQSGSGDPYPAGGGANKWDEEWENGTFNTTTGANINTSSANRQIRAKNLIPVTASSTYYFVFPLNIAGQGLWVIFYDSSENVIPYSDLPSGYTHDGNSLLVQLTTRTITMPSNCSYIRFYVTNAYGATYNHDIAINYPSSVTTYSPYSNIRPIIGVSECNVVRCGKNLFNASESIEGSMYSVDSQGNITITASDGRGWANVDGETPIKKGTYTLSRNTTEFYCDIRFKNENYATGHYITINSTSVSFTVTEDTFFKIKVDYNGNSYPIVDKLQLELGSTATAYEAYTGNTYTTSFGQTIYGWEFVASEGEYDTIKHAILNVVDLGTLNWTFYTYGTISGGYSDGLTSLIKAPATEFDFANCISDSLTLYTDQTINNSPDYSFCINVLGRIKVHVGGITTAAELKAALSGVKLYYEPASESQSTITLPTKTQVKTLLGSNNIYHDCNGNTEATYRANGGLYVAQH